MSLNECSIWKAMKVLSDEGTMIILKAIYLSEMHGATIPYLTEMFEVSESSVLRHLNTLEGVEIVTKVNDTYYVTIFGGLILESILKIQSKIFGVS